MRCRRAGHRRERAAGRVVSFRMPHATAGLVLALARDTQVTGWLSVRTSGQPAR